MGVITGVDEVISQLYHMKDASTSEKSDLCASLRVFIFREDFIRRRRLSVAGEAELNSLFRPSLCASDDAVL